MKGSDEKRSKSKPAMENDSDKSKKAAKKAKAKAPAKPRIKPSFYYVSSSEDEADILKDRFWKDLEDGKVDIFRTADLYSTVKAIGRTARPKSLAESDLQKSGIKSMNDEGTGKDAKQQRGRKSRKVAEKESKKGNAAAASKADRGKTKSRASRSLSNSRLRVNLGAKVDASDDEEDLADSDADADKISITKLRNRKKQAKAAEKREEVEEESDGDDTDDDQEDEEETDESESDDDDDVKAKRKVGKKAVSKRLKTKSKGKDEGGTQSTNKKEKAGNYGKLQKRGKREGKDGDDDGDEDGQDKDFSEEDEDLANKEVVKIKIAKADLHEKMKDNSERNDDEGDDDGNDDEEEGDESDNDSKNEMQKDSSAKGEKIKLNKGNAEEVEEEADADKHMKEPSSKIVVDSEVRRLHMEDTINSVIAQSAEYWRIHHEDKDKKQEDNTTKAEDDDVQRRGNKRKLGDKNILGEKAPPKLKKFASNPINYDSTGSDSETKKAKQNEKLVSDDIDFDGTNTTKRDSDYLGTEQKFNSSIEDDDDEEEEEEEEENQNEESPVADEASESAVDNSDQNGTKSGGDIPTRRTDSADDIEGKDIGPVDEAAEEEDNLDHLVFNLKTVDAIEPEEIVDAYSEWNIKALTNEDLSKAVKFNDFDLVQAMMRESQQFDLDQADTSGSTLTMIATQNYFMEIVELLVLNGADVNAKMKDGHTALTLACEKGLHCAVSVLLCLGASINSPLSNGDTPLMLAVKKNHFHVVRILLEHGVNIGAASASDRHCLALARQLNYQPIVEILTTHKTQLSGELFQQISMALEGSAKISAPVFPVQCFRLCDGSRFVVEFRHELQPTQTNRGMLLFVGHGCGSSSNVNVKLYGSCTVTKATLNNTALQPLNEDNFILTFCPLRDGHNELEIFTVPLTRSNYKVHLIVGAFLVTLL